VAQSLTRRRARDLIPDYVLAHVPGYAANADAATAERIFGWTINASYLVESPSGRVVVRIHEHAGRVLGADHAREAQLQIAAATVGVAPAVVHADPQHRFMVMQYIPGATWAAKDFANPDRIRLLGATLRTLHRVAPPIVASSDLRALVHGHRQRIVAVLPAEADALDALLHRADQALAACRSEEREPALIHGDLHHSNLIGIERLWLLDWEYGAVTDPLFDLGCVLAYYPQAELHGPLLLETAGLSASASPAMLRQTAWLYVLVSYLWHRVRRLGQPVRDDELAIEQGLLQRLQ
jgi:aminoglycoside phosphotransferase (APT) family kinase protein